jgi:hypothetical protein
MRVSRGILYTACLATLSLLACSESPTDPETGSAGAGGIVPLQNGSEEDWIMSCPVCLEPIPVDECQYGGDPPDNCNPPPPPPGDESSQPPGAPPPPGTPGEGGSPGGGGSDSNCDVTDPHCMQPCDPEVKGCVLDLRQKDKDMLEALTGLFRPASEYQDSVVKKACIELINKYNEYWPNFKRGAPDIDDGKHAHGAMFYNGIVHIDQNELDGATSDDEHVRAHYRWHMAQAVLHEIAHVLGKPSHHETTRPYTTAPYSYTDATGTGEKCVKPR